MFRVILNGEKYNAILNGERVRFDYFDPKLFSFLKSLAVSGVVINDVTQERHTFTKQKFFMDQSVFSGVVVHDIVNETYSFISKDRKF